MTGFSVVQDGSELFHLFNTVDNEGLTHCGRMIQCHEVLMAGDVDPSIDYDICGACLTVMLEENEQVVLLPNVVYICAGGCGRNSSVTWWKCCPEHASEDGPDVICQSCVERLHPNDQEFQYERG